MEHPRATYRLQLRPGFGFDEAAAIAPYLQALGVSHLYASPYLQAAAGSQHGYDVVDHGKLSRELGGEAGHARLCAALRKHGLGQILDIVPNHMAIGTPDNAFWWDVLENGPQSRYADYFDVDWDASESNRILLPILGERYVEALDGGKIKVERHGERFLVRYGDQRLPAAPPSLAPLLHSASAHDERGELAFLADALEALLSRESPLGMSGSARRRDQTVLFDQLRRLLVERPQAAAAVDRALQQLNADVFALDAWLERQHWRLAYWRAAATDLGYRRFFDITTLAGLRIENPEVFANSHRLILKMLHEGALDGVRIDHPDGLRDPEQYLERIRGAAAKAYVVVEKILHGDETLPSTWPVEGTTGYEFMHLVDQLFVDPDGREALDEIGARFTGRQDYAEMARSAKLEILHNVLPSERGRLVDLAYRVLSGSRSFRDCTRHELQIAVTELLASYDRYRTYVRVGVPPTPTDAAIVQQALARAAERQPDIDPRLWSALADMLLLRSGSALATEFALRAQQVTSAVAAKAIEDTLFYRYVRLLALNEVGGAPEPFGLSLEEFHAALARRTHTHSMLATATHDHKRGEDMRARLIVLSELPDEWARVVERLSLRSRRYRADVVDGHSEYVFYQTVVGAYPLSAERAAAYMRKAIREAKLHTSWTQPNAVYESAIEDFVRGALSDREFVAEVEQFVDRIAPAGFFASLARTLIKLTAPGVPDLYQGCELWDFSLVDPDNRRPVDFERRRALLGRAPRLTPEAALEELELGTPKLWLIWKVLGLRARRPALFEGGAVALRVAGADANAVVAFARPNGLVTVVPRFCARRAPQQVQAVVYLPEGSWTDALTSAPARSEVKVSELWSRFPAALLERNP